VLRIVGRGTTGLTNSLHLTIALSKLLRKGSNNLFAVFSTLPLENFSLNTLTNLPIQDCNFSINSNGSTLFGGIDKLPNFLKKGILLGQVVVQLAIAISDIDNSLKFYLNLYCESAKLLRTRINLASFQEKLIPTNLPISTPSCNKPLMIFIRSCMAQP
jgi:hypothetical protein